MVAVPHQLGLVQQHFSTLPPNSNRQSRQIQCPQSWSQKPLKWATLGWHKQRRQHQRSQFNLAMERLYLIFAVKCPHQCRLVNILNMSFVVLHMYIHTFSL
jgi:hypothetical protein